MRMIVTATETIQGAIIERYIDTICANIVLGSNFLSDFGASFTDFFGGRSNIYEGKLALIYDKAKKVLIQKAQVIGANAIVGFKVDFDKISSQGKSMFMVAASGTACFVKYAEKEIKTGIVSGIKLREMEIVETITEKLRRLNSLDESGTWKEWDTLELIEEPTVELAELLVDVYHSVYDEENRIETLLSKLDYDVLCEIIYKQYEKKGKGRKLIQRLSLFNAQLILDMLKTGKINEVACILDAGKESYTEGDLKVMKEIVIILNNLPEVWKKEFVKGGVFSKDKEVYVCTCGCKNDLGNETCEACGRNKQGLSSIAIKNVNKFKKRVEVLEKMIH